MEMFKPFNSQLTECHFLVPLALNCKTLFLSICTVIVKDVAALTDFKVLLPQ